MENSNYDYYGERIGSFATDDIEVKLHWIIYFNLTNLLTIGIYSLLVVWTTTITIYFNKIKVKEGILNTDELSIPFEQIESVELYRPLLGRILGYGTITIYGTGEGILELTDIAHPVEVKKYIDSIIAETYYR